MDDENFVRGIARSKPEAMIKLIEDGLVHGMDAIEIPLGTAINCPIASLKYKKSILEKAGYQAEILVRPISSGDSVDYERFLVVRRKQ